MNFIKKIKGYTNVESYSFSASLVSMFPSSESFSEDSGNSIYRFDDNNGGTTIQESADSSISTDNVRAMIQESIDSSISTSVVSDNEDNTYGAVVKSGIGRRFSPY